MPLKHDNKKKVQDTFLKAIHTLALHRKLRILTNSSADKMISFISRSVA